jgi:hypothetical protein
MASGRRVATRTSCDAVTSRAVSVFQAFMCSPVCVDATSPRIGVGAVGVGLFWRLLWRGFSSVSANSHSSSLLPDVTGRVLTGTGSTPCSGNNSLSKGARQPQRDPKFRRSRRARITPDQAGQDALEDLGAFMSAHLGIGRARFPASIELARGSVRVHESDGLGWAGCRPDAESRVRVAVRAASTGGATPPDRGSRVAGGVVG